ncbi:MAG: hypothetical protein K2K57_01360 [Oscillospiraceae bacterium]|nr:hypothetical protein [Oscillospiraceae bacterium]
MTNAADVLDVSEWGGLIIEKALRQKRSMTADGIIWSVLFCVMLVPILFALILPTNYWNNMSTPASVLMTVVIIAVLCLIVVAIGHESTVGLIIRARQVYESIARKVGTMSREEYISSCGDLAKGICLGGIYCGREWLFSPYGMLYRWQDIRAVKMKFYYGHGRYEQTPFKSAKIMILLADNSVERLDVLRKEDILALNDSFDNFAVFAGGMGIKTERKFV